MLSIQSISKSYKKQQVLQNVSFDAAPGECIGLLGPNGCGKSTLLHILSGTDTPDSGTILFDGKNLLDLSPEDRSHEGLFLSFQYPVEIPGVSMVNFMRAAVNEQRKYKGLPALTAWTSSIIF